MAKLNHNATFTKLHQLLLDERQAAISLNMVALQAITEDKKVLLSEIEELPTETEGIDELLIEIDKENRRNAYLLWTGLGWVRSMMGFFGQSTMGQTYGGIGQTVRSRQEGHLLTGKV